MIKKIVTYKCFNPGGFGSPNDEDILECIKIAKDEGVIIELKWYIKWSGWYSLYISEDNTLEECKDKIPRCYGL